MSFVIVLSVLLAAVLVSRPFVARLVSPNLPPALPAAASRDVERLLSYVRSQVRVGALHHSQAVSFVADRLGVSRRDARLLLGV